MAESMIRGKKQGFTVLYNSVLRDNRLSLKTKGLFALMQSFPEDWVYSVSGLADRAGIGRDGIRGCLRELENAGYLLREQQHGERGRFSCTTYVLQEQAPPENPPLTEKPSTVDPSPEKPLTEKPLPGNPPQVNKQVSKQTKDKTPIAPREVRDRVEEYGKPGTLLTSAILGLLENRNALHKPVKTLRAINGILRDLDKYSGGDTDVKLRLLEKATTCNWLTVYALKPDELPQRTPDSRQRGGRCL